MIHDNSDISQLMDAIEKLKESLNKSESNIEKKRNKIGFQILVLRKAVEILKNKQ